MASAFDTVVVGAGGFGSWIALHLARRGQRVLLLDAYGAAHSRASSGGESRIIRMSYGPDEIYTLWSQHSLRLWKELFAATKEKLFHQTGVLWLASENDGTLRASHIVLTRIGINHQLFERAELERLYPQMNFEGVSRGLFEPESGVLLARRAVAATVETAIREGVQFQIAQVQAPRSSQALLPYVETNSCERISAGQFVFACGPWLGKLFPEILGSRIFPTRQEIFFFATPPGDMRFAAPALPTWLFQGDEVYGMPDLESRGLKIACDMHGALIDPDMQSRLVSAEGVAWARGFVAKRFPALAQSPIVETRVCQYENTSNGDFLIDRHPQFANVWFAGGGSGHGFKHGPAVGEYTAALIAGEVAPEPRFVLATKGKEQHRTVH